MGINEHKIDWAGLHVSTALNIYASISVHICVHICIYYRLKKHAIHQVHTLSVSLSFDLYWMASELSVQAMVCAANETYLKVLHASAIANVHGTHSSP